jgi:hypothetical protein
MAQFIKPPGYGEPNFRPSKEEREKARRAHQTSAQRRDGNDPAHLSILRKCPCVACLTTLGKIDPHHLLGGPALGTGERVWGRRSTDRWCLPLCREDHELAQRAHGAKEIDLFQAWGIKEPYNLSAALYAAPRDVRIYTAIILAHRNVTGAI